MRKLPAALAISAAVHGGVVVWLQTRPHDKTESARQVRRTTVEVVPAPAAEPPPTEITLLDDDTVARLERGTSKPGSRGKNRQQVASSSRATSRGTTTETAPPGNSPPGNAPPSRNPLMTMRHPTIENGPSAAFWEKFEANTKPLQPKDIAGEQRDDEIATAEAHLNNPRWIANASPADVAAEREQLVRKRYEKSTSDLQPDGDGMKTERHTFKTKFNPDGTVASIKDKPNVRPHGAGLEFDATDALMRSKGIDPYSSEKLKVLDDTREERYEIGKRYRSQQLAQSRSLVQQNLERLWAMTTNLAARKQGLFELWDDCAESGSAELVAGGSAARAQVVGFIRSKLPAGSASAYTADELARFNKHRKSSTPFAPYEG
jgi:hypothetical protein